MMRFIIGVFIGYAITRIVLNPYVQKNKLFLRKEKYLLAQLKSQKTQIAFNAEQFLVTQYPDISKERLFKLVRSIINTHDNSIQTSNA